MENIIIHMENTCLKILWRIENLKCVEVWSKKQMSREFKVCILSEFGHPFISGKGTYVGGSELQMSILAKELVKRSYDVSFVTFGKPSSLCEVIEGVKIYKPFNNRFGGYSYLLPQNMYKLIKILNKIDADIYIKKGHTPLTGLVAFVAKLQNKAFVFVVSCDRSRPVSPSKGLHL